MELLIPSLSLLLFSVAIAFFVIPTLAPTILVVASAILLATVVYIHWNQFGVSEYERSTWQNNLKAYSSYILVGLVILLGYGFLRMNQGSGVEQPLGPVVLPQAGGFKSVGETIVSRLNSLMKKGRIDF
jgi:hypothetical protein